MNRLMTIALSAAFALTSIAPAFASDKTDELLQTYGKLNTDCRWSMAIGANEQPTQDEVVCAQAKQAEKAYDEASKVEFEETNPFSAKNQAKQAAEEKKQYKAQLAQEKLEKIEAAKNEVIFHRNFDRHCSPEQLKFVHDHRNGYPNHVAQSWTGGNHIEIWYYVDGTTYETWINGHDDGETDL